MNERTMNHIMMDPFASEFITDNPFDDDLVSSMSGRRESILETPVKGCLCHPCPVIMSILCLYSDEFGEVGREEEEEVEEREGSQSMDGRSQASLPSFKWLRRDGASNEFHNFSFLLLPSTSTFLLLPVLTDVAD